MNNCKTYLMIEHTFKKYNALKNMTNTYFRFYK